jgi:organic hydroperoxide reductase OsmC/OhrA
VQIKEFHFPLEVDWLQDRRVVARVEGKRRIEIAPPPVFKGTEPELWSPEDFFVAAAAACLAVTLGGFAQREGLTLHGMSVAADGIAGLRDDGHFGFRRLELRLSIVTAPGQEALALELAQKAEEACLVTASLDLPSSLEVEVASAAEDEPAEPAEAAAAQDVPARF